MDVFLGSSRHLSDMRVAFAALVDSLFDPVFDSCDEEIVARMWENESYAMERDRSKQAAYDEVIRACDLAFFLVDGYLGDYTLHEYQVARDSYAASGKPYTTVWVRSGMPFGGTVLADMDYVPTDIDDANTRVMLTSAMIEAGVHVRNLLDTNTTLLDMLECMTSKYGQVPLSVRDNSVWSGHKRLISLEGVSPWRVDRLESWLRHR